MERFNKQEMLLLYHCVCKHINQLNEDRYIDTDDNMIDLYSLKEKIKIHLKH